MPKIVTGTGAPLPLANVDTDVIMPKRFLRIITREGLADGTLADLRFTAEGAARPDFVLNKDDWKSASILVVGDNFGCGSSREHAVWGLKQLGIDAIVGTTFAGIFYDNARKNGLALPMVSPQERDALLQLTEASGQVEITVNMADQTVSAGDMIVKFDMDAATRQALLDDRDDTLDTLKLSDAILAYEAGLSEKQIVRVIK